MHEVRITLPPEYVSEALRLARAAGIQQVTACDVFVHGPDRSRRMLSVETSTPRARAFVESCLSSRELSRADCTLTSREVRSIVNGEPMVLLTRPMSEPSTEVIQDLWQLSHITPSYLARAIAGSILLSTGVIENDPIAIVVAALFLPYLSQVLSISFGIWRHDRDLIRQGVVALTLSTAIAVAAGAATAWFSGGAIQFGGFRSPLRSFIVSALIGLTAGLSSADDTGRRYLIGVAAAVQLAVFPVWLGATAVFESLSPVLLYARLSIFAINLLSIAAGALAGYASLSASPPLPGKEGR